MPWSSHGILLNGPFNDDLPDDIPLSRASGSALPKTSSTSTFSGDPKALPLYHSGNPVSDEVLDPTQLTFHKSLGVGGQAEVFLTTWRRLCGKEISEDVIAVKKMKAGGKSSMRELLMSKTDHPNIVRCLGVAETASTLFIAMDYCAGGSLYNRIYTPGATPLTWIQRVQVLCDISEGMAYLHSQFPKIIHRDLKSTNILLAHPVCNEDMEPQARITDFGVARTAEEDEAIQCEMTKCVGTWRWTAPEVFRSSNYDEKVDIYSFAMVIYELITSKLPYSDKWPNSSAGMSVSAILNITQGLRPAIKKSHFKGCPTFLRDMMLKCWGPDPSARPSFAEVAAQLREKLLILKAKAKQHHICQDHTSVVFEEDSTATDPHGTPTSGWPKAMFGVSQGYNPDCLPFAPKTMSDLRPPLAPTTNPDPPKMPMTAPAGLERFQPGSNPPTPPTSNNFHYEKTTIFIENNRPDEIGNCILDYLSTHFDTCITKLTPQKCSFKAEVFVDKVVACTMKIRIHSRITNLEQSENAQAAGYAVRFQRRSGCAFVFHNVFCSVQKSLSEQFAIVQSEPEADDPGRVTTDPVDFKLDIWVDE